MTHPPNPRPRQPAHGPPPGYGPPPPDYRPVPPGYPAPQAVPYPAPPPRHGMSPLMLTVVVTVAILIVVFLVVVLASVRGDDGAAGAAEATSDAAEATAAPSEEDTSAAVEETPGAEPVDVPTEDPIAVAKAWTDAVDFGEEAEFLALTCADPSGKAADRIDYFETGIIDGDGGYDWTVENYMLAGLTDTTARVFSGPTLHNTGGVTPWEIMSLVVEDGAWKVCDAYYPSTEEAVAEQEKVKNGDYSDLN